ncbi:MAG TPA: histidine phosphatase family protein [Gaiellaceae bacterium]
MRVLLVRHADAAPGTPDDTRPLTPDGRSAARALGDRLRAEHVDAVVSSPLLRARETADAVARASGVEATVHEGLAPGATASSLRDAVAGHGETVVAVGHQPDCGDIVEELTGERRPFATCSCAELVL